MSPEPIWDWITLGLAVVRKSRAQHKKALAIFFSILDHEPDHIECHLHVGAIRRVQGYLPEAEKHLVKAHALDPASVPVQLELCTLFIDLGRLDDASPILDRLLGREPKNGSAWFLRGRIMVASGQIEKAAMSFSKAVDIHPENEWIHLELSHLFRLQDKKEAALAATRKALALNPQNPHAHLQAGMIFREMDATERVKWHLDQAFQLNLRSEVLHVELGRYYHLVGDFGAALKAYGNALDINPNHGSAYYWKGVSLFEANQFAMAERCFKKSLQLNPDGKIPARYLQQIQDKLTTIKK